MTDQETGAQPLWQWMPEQSSADRPTRAMLIVLWDALDRAHRAGHSDPRISPALYPAGQFRLIRAGLYRRGLIDESGALTDAGVRAGAPVLAQMARPDGWIEFIARFHPEPVDSDPVHDPATDSAG